MTDKTFYRLNKCLLGFCYILLSASFVCSFLMLSGCVMIDSQVALTPSASLSVSGYSRGGVTEASAQQPSSNGVHETWTDSQGGGQVEVEATVDPDLPALP